MNKQEKFLKNSEEETISEQVKKLKNSSNLVKHTTLSEENEFCTIIENENIDFFKEYFNENNDSDLEIDLEKDRKNKKNSFSQI